MAGKMKTSQAKQNAQNPGVKTPQGPKPIGYDSTTPATKQSPDTKANLNNTAQVQPGKTHVTTRITTSQTTSTRKKGA